jgi:PAS domain S-box-containing protein
MIPDITERKLAEEENRKTAMSMRSLIEAAPMGIGIFHGNRHVYVNPAFVKMFGYQDADEILDKPIEALYIEGDRDLALEKIRDNASGSSKGASYSAMGLKKDGTEFDLQAWTASVQYDGKTASLVFVIDVSETKSLRAQLVQAQKMEAVGTLAGGIAHDFNNLLTVAMGYAELILMDLNEGDRHYEELQIIGKAAKDGSDLVQRILTFSRKVEPEPKPVNMNNEIKRIHKLLERTIPKMIRIELNLATEIKVVHADPGQIEQAVLNLALNAKDAMGEEGTLTIETANTRLDEDFCRNNIGLTPGQYVKISIKDTGPGIPKEHLDRIFEPFFTTKKRGEGTGLGLAMVFGIVRSHSGHINCVSHIGKGATFNIYLPVRKFETREEQETNTTYVTQGDELILIVDDEESIRRLGTRLLQKAGYNTLTAKNGLEAIEVFRDRKDDVSLVILDLIMPEMGGKKCLEELFRINPDLKVLVASGYSAEAPVEEVMAMGARKFLAKPYSRRDLLESVRKTLDTDGSGAD